MAEIEKQRAEDQRNYSSAALGKQRKKVKKEVLDSGLSFGVSERLDLGIPNQDTAAETALVVDFDFANPTSVRLRASQMAVESPSLFFHRLKV